MVRPRWLRGLLEERFFENCGIHENSRNNGKNIFCLQCCLSFCPHCVPSQQHQTHHLLQVRRYVYHDVVRQADLEKLIDCSCIQPYTINSAKVIFINERPQSRPYSKQVATNLCITCHRILQHPFNFCSLSCKVNHYEYEGVDLSSILLGFNDSDLLTFFDFRGLMSMGQNYVSAAITDEAAAEEEEVIRKRPMVQSAGNRRKGAPHRSPLA